MGRAPNQNSIALYAKLVSLYPAAYRRKYGQPMVQTLDDMLEAESSRAGWMAVWLRALLELPVSLTKEHLTNGRNLSMNRNLKLAIAGTALILLLANGASYWFGYLQARRSVGIDRVTPTALAEAMQQDRFYSTYGDSALLFTGTVTQTRQEGSLTLATFKTGQNYSLTCQFAHGTIMTGQTMSVAAPGGSAERQPRGVLLPNCLQN